jgi:hypothetical protein
MAGEKIYFEEGNVKVTMHVIPLLIAKMHSMPNGNLTCL